MLINQKKSKIMIFNFTQKHQFTTRLELNGDTLEVVPKTKLLGVIIQDDLKWDSNIASLVKRANARMVILRKLSEFCAPREDMKTIYVSYIRSILEQSSVVWHKSLTLENQEDLTRIQKSACRIILKHKYTTYQKALEVLDLKDLSARREKLCKSFARKLSKNTNMLKLSDTSNTMNLRNQNKFEVTHCNTERLRMSSIPQMQRSMKFIRKISNISSPCHR